ncbi:MAG TPA: TetR/AcrR family transcriptional regulator [Jiangellaceae bacterium]|nr:TetR/AcrR family transcriptional regulator [Jiangellaceae bacterium]
MRPERRPNGRDRSFTEEARRAQIVTAAAQAVAKWGYANASLSRIADQAGTSKSVISYHFTGKDELLTLMVTQFFEQTWQYMEGRIEAATTSAGKVQAWVRSQLEYFAQHRTAFLAMSDIVVSHRADDGSRPFADAEDEEVDALAETLAEGQRAGEFRDFDPRSVATILIRCTEGVLGSWAMDEDVDLDAQTTVLVDFIDHAIRRDGP